MIRNYLIIDNETSASRFLYISAGASYDSAERSRRFTKVVGKNGDIISDDGRFENIEVKYPCFCYGLSEADLQDKTRDIASWLYHFTDYVKIEDTYKPDFYRMGIPVGKMNWSTKLARIGESELQFNCKPQLFYKSGDTAQTFSASGTITNPSLFPSLPHIRVNGSGAGSITIGDYTLTFSDIPSYIDIETEIRYAHKGDTNLNNNVTASDNVNYMRIDGGAQSVSFGGGVTSVVITGKWWTL